jgi:hypothetical protein
MTEQDTQPLQQRTVARQTEQPARVIDGFQWVNPMGGQNGNNSETYVWNGDSRSWQLIRSTGPDTPLYSAAGATWTDTSNGTVKNYRGGGWKNVGVTDHTNLSNVGPSQHHSRPDAGNALADQNNRFDVDESSINHSNLAGTTSHGYIRLGGGNTRNGSFTGVGQTAPTFLDGGPATFRVRTEEDSDTGDGIAEVRLRDVHNGVTVAGPFTNNNQGFVWHSASFNLPTGDALLQLQLRDGSGNGYGVDCDRGSINISNQ